jgi:hypothetical protein
LPTDGTDSRSELDFSPSQPFVAVNVSEAETRILTKYPDIFVVFLNGGIALQARIFVMDRLRSNLRFFRDRLRQGKFT